MANKQKKAGPKFRENSNIVERRQVMTDYVLDNGFFSVTRPIKLKWAEIYDVSEVQISHDMKKVLDQIAIPNVVEMSKKFKVTYENALRGAESLAKNEDPAIQNKGIDLLIKASAAYTKFMEDYGHKQKVADNLNINSGNELKKVNEELSKLKGLTPDQEKIVREVLRGNV